MELILPINKPLGATSYDVIRDLKKQYPGETIGHAGTLDPLADGLLICLVGKEATRRQVEFMNVEKVYEFEVLFGISTDTYDILGLIDKVAEYEPNIVMDMVASQLEHFNGVIQQQVPPFSAVKVKGRPLYRWYLDGKISQVEVPVKDVEIKDINIISTRTTTSENLNMEITNLVNTVDSGFRKQKVMDGWDTFFKSTHQESFLIVKIEATVSKGTYVRAIANDIGKRIGIPACTIRITRTKIGDFKLNADT